MKSLFALCTICLVSLFSFGCSGDSDSGGSPSPPDSGLAWKAVGNESQITILAEYEELLEIHALDPSADESVTVSISLEEGTPGVVLAPITCTLSADQPRCTVSAFAPVGSGGAGGFDVTTVTVETDPSSTSPTNPETFSLEIVQANGGAPKSVFTIGNIWADRGEEGQNGFPNLTFQCSSSDFKDNIEKIVFSGTRQFSQEWSFCGEQFGGGVDICPLLKDDSASPMLDCKAYADGVGAPSFWSFGIELSETITLGGERSGWANAQLVNYPLSAFPQADNVQGAACPSDTRPFEGDNFKSCICVDTFSSFSALAVTFEVPSIESTSDQSCVQPGS